MPTPTRWLIGSLLTLVAACSVVWLLESQLCQHADVRNQDFQRLVGGLGFGPATDLSACAFAFDPRLEGNCTAEHGPFPGGSCFCPRHAGTVLTCPPVHNESDVHHNAPK